MNVLVTGSTGFIGAQLCRALVERGHYVRAFHRPTSNLTLLEGLPVEHVLGDLAQAETLQSACQGVEAVFHTAALLGGRVQPGRMYTVIVEGTRAVAQAALQAGVGRLVYTSSVASLGVPEADPTSDIPFPLLDESHSWNFRLDDWPYGYAKYLAELEIQKAVVHGLDAVIVNPGYVIGAGDIYRQVSSIVVQVARRRVPVLTEGGLNVVHIADVVDGHLAALELGRRGERYILGGQNMSHQTLIQKIAAAAGVHSPVTVLPADLVRSLAGIYTLLQAFVDLPVSASDMHLAGYHFYYDTHKARTGLQLPAPRSVDDAIQEAFAWFARMGAVKLQQN
jgi:dihydroflavonol-4-reductase